MKRDKLPVGWDDAKLKKVLAHYEEQTEAADTVSHLRHLLFRIRTRASCS